MKIYFAGYGNGSLANDLHLKMGKTDLPILESYAYKNNVMEAFKLTSDVFLDSGAFTAMTQGKDINLDEYIAFIKEHADKVTVYAALDVIGDWRATLKNLDYMVKHDVVPLPTYHYGEPLEVLAQFLEFPYIAIGGAAHLRNRGLIMRWLNYAWAHITDKDGNVPTKVHGFGITSFEVMMGYPWESVDSTSWLVGGKFGQILLPNSTARMMIADDSPYKKKFGSHVDSLPVMQRERIDEEIVRFGFDPAKLRSCPYERNAYNIKAFLALTDIKKHNLTKYDSRQEGLFDG
jgi:hypothetical protein